MRKTKSDALWNALSAEQLETLDQWLFDENLSFAEAWPRAQDELGFKGSVASLKRYYARRKKERTLLLFKDLQKDLAVVNEAATDTNALRAGAMKLLSAFLFQWMSEAPEKVKEWAPLAKLMVDNDRNEAQREMQAKEHKLKRELKAKDHEIRRELKAEEHKLRQEALAFAKQRFEYRTVERSLKALPELNQLAEAKKDPHLQRYEENARWNKARRAFFGPDSNVAPESEQEEAEMLAAQKEREARKAEAERRERERIQGTHPPTPSSPYYKEYMEAMAAQERKEAEREEGGQRMEEGKGPNPEQPENPDAEPGEKEPQNGA
jgi:hypothetical protein